MFRPVFDHVPKGKEASELILSICKGNHQAATYALEFRTLAAESSWNESALKTVLQLGLDDNICTEMACHDDKVSLD